MLMEILFDVDGLSHLKMSVLVCAKLYQLCLTRLVKSCQPYYIQSYYVYTVPQFYRNCRNTEGRGWYTRLGVLCVRVCVSVCVSMCAVCGWVAG